MPETHKPGHDDLPEYSKRAPGSQFEPHWAIKLLHDPRGEDWDNLAKPGEYPEIGRFPDEPVTLERALGMFDCDSLGWLPYWFPRRKVLKRWTEDEDRIPVGDEEHLVWFDKALAWYAQTEWPPEGSLPEKRRAVALALLYTLHGVESDSIPAPEEM